MARGVVMETWDGEGKFLQQMGRKYGQHCTGAATVSRISLVVHPFPGLPWSGVAFCQVHVQFYQNM